MAWYRQYRPQKISDLNIKTVRESLLKMMESGKIPQSLLFAGPKGTGKTSTSRILAVMLNDVANADLVDQVYFAKVSKKKLSFNEPNPKTDFAKKVYAGHSFVVHELDAASNRRIDDIRSLKERLNLPPQEGKMAVYILDEVHMLTNEAFNALLKILEEPPAHVLFILATTELHKIPETIVSRCSLIRFQKANQTEIVEALERILKAEKIKYQVADLEKIAARADGSFRDAVKILEMACQSGALDLSAVETVLASNNQQYIKQILEAVLDKNEPLVAEIFEELRAGNFNQKNFYQDFLEFLHQDLLINLGVKKGEALNNQRINQFFLKNLVAADLDQELPIIFLALELKLLEIIGKSKASKGGDNSGANGLKKKPKIDLTIKAEEKIFPIKKDTVKVKKKLTTPSKEPQSFEKSPLSQETWQKLVDFVRERNFSLAALLKSCQLDGVIDGTAKILVYYDFHKEQLEQNKYLEVLNHSCGEIFGESFNFDFVLEEGADRATKNLVSAARELLI